MSHENWVGISFNPPFKFINTEKNSYHSYHPIKCDIINLKHQTKQLRQQGTFT